MRISTNLFFDSGAARMSTAQSNLAKIQEQLSSGRRILTPSDDPVAAARALELTQTQATNSQYGVNRRNAADALNSEESTLQSVTDVLQNLKTSIVEAGSPALDNSQRSFIATELSGRLDDLLAHANATDGTGAYIFSGYQTGTQPFTKTTTGASYNGDQGARTLQVGPQRQFAVNDTGPAVFERIRNGNGIFVTGAVAGNTNTGSGVISPGSVTDPTALTGHAYSIAFSTDASGNKVYDVIDTTTSTTISTANAYTSGNSISFDGMQMQISGTPADGDSFTVAPSTNQSIFTTLTNLVNLLNTPVQSDADRANLAQGLQAANNLVANTLDNVLTVRASVGSRLNELDTLNTQGDDLDAQYAESISNLQDLDYTKAITDLTKQKTMLEALQQSFVQISGLSLFKLL